VNIFGKCLRKAACVMLSAIVVSALFLWLAPADVPADTTYVFDGADLLTDEEESSLESLLADVSADCGVPVVCVTTNEGMTSSELRLYLADDILTAYFDTDGDASTSPDGLAYGIDISSRTDTVVSGGSVYEELDQNDLDDLRETAENEIVGVSQSDHEAFYSAFEAFAKRSEHYLSNSVLYHLSESLLPALVFAVVVTIIVMAILVSVQKSHMKAGAADYADRRSVQLKNRQDIYLRTTVVHHEAPRNTGGGRPGGPSGSFSGGGGGSFGSSSGHF
jgi:uncharacterized membrane protein YgcG